MSHKYEIIKTFNAFKKLNEKSTKSVPLEIIDYEKSDFE